MATTESGSAITREQGRDNHTALTIELSPELLRRIEAAAAQDNMPVQAYVEEVLEQAVLVPDEEKQSQRHPISREAYEQIIALRDRLACVYPGKVFPDSVEEIRQMREERDRHLESLSHPEHE